VDEHPSFSLTINVGIECAICGRDLDIIPRGMKGKKLKGAVLPCPCQDKKPVV